MGHTGDDVVHKISLKMKTYWWKRLKISVLVSFDIPYRLRYLSKDK